LLLDVERGQKLLLPSTHEYETEMLRYGGEAVRESKKQKSATDAIHKPGIGQVQLTLTRAVMRVINAVSALKRRVLQNIMRVRGEN
jgi:hypothetical protein